MQHRLHSRGLPSHAAFIAVWLPSLLAAQESRPRATATVNRACSQLASSPSLLGRSPEGRALLRFNRELGGAAEVIALRGDSNRRLDIKRIAEVQRGVDSLMQIVVTYKRPDGSDVETVMIRRGDSLPRLVHGKLLSPGAAMFDEIEGRIRATFPGAVFSSTDTVFRSTSAGVEAAIRSLQPQIAAFAGSPNARIALRSVAPSGYLGIHLMESKITMASASGALTNYCDYPVIEAVDPDSPAARAGLSAGDTVLAYNGRDVQKTPVNYSALVVPGQVVRVRVKRGEKLRESVVTVGARHDDRNVVGAIVSSSAPAVEMMLSGSGIAIIAGAQLSALDGELAQSLGVEPGILVMRVPAGTAAADAGLRGGDVIRSVNGTPVRDLVLLARAYNAPGAREVKLAVSSRNAGMRTVLLRFPERD